MVPAFGDLRSRAATRRARTGRGRWRAVPPRGRVHRCLVRRSPCASPSTTTCGPGYGRASAISIGPGPLLVRSKRWLVATGASRGARAAHAGRWPFCAPTSSTTCATIPAGTPGSSAAASSPPSPRPAVALRPRRRPVDGPPPGSMDKYYANDTVDFLGFGTRKVELPGRRSRPPPVAVLWPGPRTTAVGGAAARVTPCLMAAAPCPCRWRSPPPGRGAPGLCPRLRPRPSLARGGWCRRAGTDSE